MHSIQDLTEFLTFLGTIKQRLITGEHIHRRADTLKLAKGAL